MPIWIDDDHLDGAWLCRAVPSLVVTITPSSSSDEEESTSSQNRNISVRARDMSNLGRRGAVPRNGGTILLTVVAASSGTNMKEDQHNDQDNNGGDDQPEKVLEELVLKQIPADRAELSRQLGLAREAFFYQEMAPQLSSLHNNNNNQRGGSSSLPRIYYAYGNFETGEKCLILENLKSSLWVDSGIFFGPGNPNNWNRDLSAMLEAAYYDSSGLDIPTAATVAKATFQAMAQIHAAFWNRKTLLAESNHWLRGHSWIQGQGRDSWEASQAVIQGIWKAYTANETTQETSSEDLNKKTGTIQWSTTVRGAVEKAVQGISWQAQLDRLHSGQQQQHWTLVHGDFWPGNVMWNVTDGQLRLLDWEMVGLGSGPQDLGQYILSNMDPAERRACEHDLLRTYHQELVRCGLAEDEFNSLWDYVWREYRIGGVERWLWFLIYFVGQPGMAGWAQFFHDQIASFMEDHGLTPDDITQPRP